jgi:ribose 5-phosphate isomerase A
VTHAEQALSWVSEGQTIGLGTGRAATAFIHALATRVKSGLRVRGVATSERSASLARELGIPLVSLDEIAKIDLVVDGADEVDPNLNLIKGRGGALLREKVVASAAARFVVLIGPEKLVQCLGEGGYLPVEVVPFALGYCRRRLEALGTRPVVRLDTETGEPYLTDNRNPILDCHLGRIIDPPGFEASIRAIPGVVATGLFLGMADRVVVQEGDSVRVMERPNP